MPYDDTSYSERSENTSANATIYTSRDKGAMGVKICTENRARTIMRANGSTGLATWNDQTDYGLDWGSEFALTSELRFFTTTVPDIEIPAGRVLELDIIVVGRNKIKGFTSDDVAPFATDGSLSYLIGRNLYDPLRASYDHRIVNPNAPF